MPASFRIYNTLTRTVESFEPLEEGKVGVYVCGMTVYDHAHVGHARAMVVFDAFVRTLRHRGWDVRFVRNFTDVDDKIIARAAETGETPMELAERFIGLFQEDAAALGLIEPDSEPRVSTSIQDILELIQRLFDEGHAYASEGNVWFKVDTFSDYGALSGQDVDQLRNPDAMAGKASPADFALWKAAKPGEPSWESPWGPGRPGWHIECSAMARCELGATFDIHGGGLDLVFPHHENEVAQSVCGNQAHYAKYWMHNGLLTLQGGGKMSKSDKGSVFRICDAVQAFPGEAIKLYLLQNHYRSPLLWEDDSLPDALAKLSRLYEAREAAEAMGGEEDPDMVAEQLGKDAQKVLELGRAFEARYYECMDEDFRCSQALGMTFELARAINRFAGHKKARRRGGPVVAPALAGLALLPQTLGVLGMGVADFQEEVKAKRSRAMGIDPSEVDGLLVARKEARASKDWAKADTIRDQLTTLGVVVMDSAEGVIWRIRLDEPET
jgi:cysteinyl-tRNA synthetase